MAPSLENLAQQSQLALYHRYDDAVACRVLEIDEATLADIREEGFIEYLELPNGQIRYFGYQILNK